MEFNVKEIDDEYLALMYRIGKVIPRESTFQQADKYIRGLMSQTERKNGWQLSEYIGYSTPYAIQQFLYRSKFSADSLRDVQRMYISEKLGEEDGVLVVDETGFLKQGKKSCGVKRQYSGTAGRVENCQIGVFLTYASRKGHCPIDRRLYLPDDWAEDQERRTKAGIPESVKFQTKPEMALDMIKSATTAEVPYKWVTGDCVYGDYGEIRLWLEQNEKCYVMSVSGKAYYWYGYSQERISDLLKNLPEEGWFTCSCGKGSKGGRIYDWFIQEINPPAKAGWKRWVLVRSNKEEKNPFRAYICCAPAETTAGELIKVAGTRWTVESCVKESKGEVGLDQYEVRSYNGWYKHITLACIALALITVISSQSLDRKTLQEHNPASSSLDAFKKGRNLRG
jgi:SRSO17 transposase